jgi:hypothetical protein
MAGQMSREKKNRIRNPGCKSPWSQKVAYDPTRELEKRLKADADRIGSVSRDDAEWFKQHPGRRFHLREAAPCEKDHCGCGWVVVIRGAGGRVRLGIDPKAKDASECDTDEYCQELYGSIVADPRQRSLVEGMQLAIKAVADAIRT